MKKFWMKVVPMSVFALAIFASACSDQVGPDREQLLAPEAASLAKGGRSEENPAGREKAAERDKKGPKVKARKNGRESEFRLAVKPRGKAGQSASAWLDEKGGELSLNGHTLTVPAGAVSEPTHFTIRESHQTVGDGLVVLALDLNASRGTGRAHRVDVGAKGFDEELTLCLGYEEAVDWQHEALDGAAVIWLRNATQANEAVDSWVEGDKVCANLDHFSLWGLGWP